MPGRRPARRCLAAANDVAAEEAAQSREGLAVVVVVVGQILDQPHVGVEGCERVLGVVDVVDVQLLGRSADLSLSHITKRRADQ